MSHSPDRDIYTNSIAPLPMSHGGLFIVEFIDEAHTAVADNFSEVTNSALAGGYANFRPFGPADHRIVAQAYVPDIKRGAPDEPTEHIKRVVGWGMSSQVDYHSRGGTMAVIDGIFVRSELDGLLIQQHGVGSAIMHSLLSRHDDNERAVVRHKPTNPAAQRWLTRLAFKDPKLAENHREIKRGPLSLVPPERPLSSDYELHGPSVAELVDLLIEPEKMHWLAEVAQHRPNQVKNLAEDYPL